MILFLTINPTSFPAVALLSGQSPNSGRRRPASTTTVAPRRAPAVVEYDDEEAAGAELQLKSECPEPNGFFADPDQCDKYYECSDNKITEKLCADGKVFNDYSSTQEKCDLPLNIDCSQRPALREYYAFIFYTDKTNVCRSVEKHGFGSKTAHASRGYRLRIFPVPKTKYFFFF